MFKFIVFPFLGGKLCMPLTYCILFGWLFEKCDKLKDDLNDKYTSHEHNKECAFLIIYTCICK